MKTIQTYARIAGALVLISMVAGGFGDGLFGGVSIAFYGAATALRGYLVFRSGYLPRFVGVLLAIGGLAFVVSAFRMVLAPGYAAGWLLALLLPGGLSLMLWLLIKGVDVQKWEARAAAGTI